MKFRSKLLTYLVDKKAFNSRKFVLVDIGARGGPKLQWQAFGGQIKVIGFEPDKEECERLNKSRNVNHEQYFPVALHKDERVRTFYIADNAPSCGFYKHKCPKPSIFVLL